MGGERGRRWEGKGEGRKGKEEGEGEGGGGEGGGGGRRGRRGIIRFLTTKILLTRFPTLKVFTYYLCELWHDMLQWLDSTVSPTDHSLQLPLVEITSVSLAPSL